MSGVDTIAVVIPTFNAEGFVTRAIASARAQTLPAHEIILVDDCSTDGTRAVLEAAAREDPRIRIVDMPRNGGPSAARNAGIRTATSEWIAILDADDAFAPERLAVLVPFAVETGADFVADDLAFYDAWAERITGSGLSEETVIPDRPITLRDYLEHNRADGRGFDWGLLKPVFRRQALPDRDNPYDPDVRHGEDFRLAVELLLNGARLRLLKRPLYLYTQRQGAISGRASGMTRTTIAYKALSVAAIEMSRDPRLASDHGLVALLRARARGLHRLDDADFASNAIRSGAIRQILARGLRDPGFLPRMLRQIARALGRRLRTA